MTDSLHFNLPSHLKKINILIVLELPLSLLYVSSSFINSSRFA